MNTIIHRIDAIAEQKDSEEEERYFHKYAIIFDQVYKFLSTQKVLLYGGTAINDLMPSKHKIYKPTALPDIDVFSTEAKDLTKKLVKYFHKKGYSNITTSASEALHEGTYKVFVDSIQVADITQVSKVAFKRLSENSVISQTLGVRVVNPQFLRMTLHLILSKGDSDSVHRWEKVIQRLIAFYQVFPPESCNLHKLKDGKVSKIPETVVESFYDAMHGSEYVFFGMHELELLLRKKLPFVSVATLQMFVDGDLQKSAKNIVDKLIHHEKDLHGSRNAHSTETKEHLAAFSRAFKVSNIYPADDFIPEHIIISYKRETLAILYNVKECVNYNTYRGYRIASVHAIARMYMCMMMSSYKHFEKYANQLECVVNTITLMNNKMRGTRKHLYSDVIDKCYGNVAGIITMRKERLIRIAKKNSSIK